ncbi:hypothetical protein CPB85DRAFT_1560340 [Mucidula mucida]|nr:hypothetical protein CPB85DRAFT_1560340 [Mucidula mucida]
MPVPTPTTASAPSVSKVKSAGNPPARKKRIVRRRGRAVHAGDSDDEIEREVGTDSDSDDDSFASTSSETETEPSSDRRARVLTPNTSQSPTTASNGQSNGRDASFFAAAGSWSEMVADETANGAADLPVIDFSELNDQALATKRPRKAKKPAQKVKPATSLPSPPLSVNEEHEEEEPAPRPQFNSARRPPGQSARQAYQTRLESDPSYVPTVGEFWGHDDRLLDKDLRSLSGWWRGRWQGRGGRGRGMFGMRGRGGFMGRNVFPQQGGDEPSTSSNPALPSPPPVEREWTHDGFEELKKSEESRRDQQQSMRGGWGFRGRGTPIRGRGGFARGAFAGSPARTASTLPSGRIWYPIKPELAWTKQHEGFLYMDSSLRARRGRGAGFRVKLPGSRPQVIHSPLRSLRNLSVSNPAATSIGSVGGSDYGGKIAVVKLPSAEATSQSVARSQAEEDIVTKVDDLTIEDVFTVRPQLVTAKPIPLPNASTSNHRLSISQPPPSVQQQLEQLSIPTQSDQTRWTQTEEAVLRNPPDHSAEEPQASSSTSESSRPTLPPLQTSFTPPAQPSPYMSPYQYSMALPPGIAMNPMGMTFEVATGRPVYIPPPVPPVYNPRMMPPPFVPGHMHHHSAASGEFLVPSPPPMSFIDPSTGMPIFSFPQPSRIEIRAPSDPGKAFKPAASRTPSGLRSSAVAFEPTKLGGDDDHLQEGDTEDGQETGVQSYPGGEGEEGIPPQQAGMMYAPYGQYYYPDGYGGYMPYMDMSQMPQYEMYPQDTIPQGTVYY